MDKNLRIQVKLIVNLTRSMHTVHHLRYCALRFQKLLPSIETDYISLVIHSIFILLCFHYDTVRSENGTNEWVMIVKPLVPPCLNLR